MSGPVIQIIYCLPGYAIGYAPIGAGTSFQELELDTASVRVFDRNEKPK